MAQKTIAQFADTPDMELNDKLLLQRGNNYYSVKIQNLGGGLFRVFLTISQSQMQALNTTPQTLFAAQGAGTYLSAVEVDARLDHNGTTYATATKLQVKLSGAAGVLCETSTSFVGSAVDRQERMLPDRSSANNFRLFENTALVVTADADATNNGGTVYIDATIKICRFAG